MNKKLFWIIPLKFVCTLIVFFVLVFILLTIVEYRPKAVEDVPFTSGTERIEKGEEVTLFSWNIGYAGLGKNEDFFMDGGKMVRPASKKVVETYFEGIKNTIRENPADIIFIQEADVHSKRTWNINEYEALKADTNKAGSFAYNYKCFYVPFPFPPIGHVESGLVILTNYETVSAQRVALPVPFKWPVRLVNLKRAILTTRIPVYENGVPTGKELVLADFHLEAFDDGEGKIAQTKALKEFIDTEYAKGNYVIAGGDFNQSFPGSTAFPIIWSDGWIPGQLEEDMLDEGWQFVFDDSKPTSRADPRPYNDEDALSHNWQYYVIDGLIISPNITKKSINVIDEDFRNSDHNPVKMRFVLE